MPNSLCIVAGIVVVALSSTCMPHMIAATCDVPPTLFPGMRRVPGPRSNHCLSQRRTLCLR
jgi:hypothetical protein